MITFVFTLCVIILALAGLSLGMMLGRAPMKGSCGGLSCIPSADCAGCPNRLNKDGEL